MFMTIKASGRPHKYSTITTHSEDQFNTVCYAFNFPSSI